MTRRSLILIRVLWVAATVGLAALWRGEALVLLIPLAMFGPILREVSPPRDVDERERLVDYRASHVAFVVTYGVLFLLFARSWIQLEREPPNELWLLLVAPLLVRVTLAVGRGTGARRLLSWPPQLFLSKYLKQVPDQPQAHDPREISRPGRSSGEEDR